MSNKVKTTAKQVKTTATKKTVKQLVKMTDEQKEKARLKRLANPQSSHLASKVAKVERLEFKHDAKANLIEAKRLHNKVDLSNKTYENLADLKLAKKVINAICKKSELIKIAEQAVRTNKDGSYSVFYFSQMVQKIVKLLGTGKSIELALLTIKNDKK